MRYLTIACLVLLGNLPPLVHGQPASAGKKASIYDFKVTTIDGQKVDLAKYKGKVLLIVNVASECGYTDQYKAMQALHAKYGKDGLAILAFPCNDFGSQEPGNEAKIKAFAKKNYSVEFDLFSKVKILGKDGAPLYQFLTSKDANPKHAGEVKWNFEKFIIGRDGSIVARFLAETEPDAEDLLALLRKELNKK
ncbi:MAG: glutathione peroxidase [Gemmataceae bacterium]|nr:glutathione peroxidase [Gemmataceae bacterium]